MSTSTMLSRRMYNVAHLPKYIKLNFKLIYKYEIDFEKQVD